MEVTSINTLYIYFNEILGSHFKRLMYNFQTFIKFTKITCETVFWAEQATENRFSQIGTKIREQSSGIA